jgi:hypothetical protein
VKAVPFSHQQDFILEAPYLLLSADKEYLIEPAPKGLLVREGVGALWGEPALLSLDREHFSAALDGRGAPHLLFAGQGHYYHLPAPTWEAAEPGAPFYRDEGRQSGPLLLAGDQRGNLHLISPVSEVSAERWWLLHHLYSSGSWQEPRTIDSGSGAVASSGSPLIDESGRLHFIYSRMSPRGSALYYRQFDTHSSRWGEAAILPTTTPGAFPSLAADEEQNLHLLWSTAVEGKHYIYYRFKGGPGRKRQGWTPETVISSAMEAPPFPFFTYRSGELFIAWLDGSALFRYRFAGDRWEGAAPQQFKKPRLLRIYSLDPAGKSLSYWAAVENDEPITTAIPAIIDRTDPASDLSRIDRFSGKLFNRIADLSTTRDRLEEKIRSRDREMLLFSQQSEKEKRLLQKNLESKDGELIKLQQDFKQIVDNLKEKIERGRQSAESERKRFLRSLEEHKQESRRFENTLREKEKLIAQLERRCREQQLLIKELEREKEALRPKTRKGRRGLKDLWEGLFPRAPD